jgi:hypothetical protein
MSAYIVDKPHVDALVRAALDYGSRGYQGARMQWWQTDDAGEYAGWRYLDRIERDEEDFYTPSQLGQILVSENVASVAYRYPDDDVDAGELPGPIDAYYLGPYVYADPGRTMSPGEVFKAIDGLDYQSCEHPGWRASEAFAFLTALRETVCRHVPGYESAAWEVSA